MKSAAIIATRLANRAAADHHNKAEFHQKMYDSKLDEVVDQRAAFRKQRNAEERPTPIQRRKNIWREQKSIKLPRRKQSATEMISSRRITL